ncbi:MAG: helix-turn-helix transcriptional regulator [Mogibacterium sp.]|nr:helix-turn-helix transcriptional regulator [Mogibacterium sp.]
MNYVIKRYLNACDAKIVDLSAESGISLSTISRYINGVRTPSRDSDNIEKLALAIFRLLEERTEDNQITQEEILDDLRESIFAGNRELTQELQVDNLNKLVIEVGISKANFAKKMHYSSSGISRILSKENKPRSVELFVNQVVDFIYENYNMNKAFKNLQVFLERETGMYPKDVGAASEIVRDWLLGRIASVNDSDSDDLINKIDEFDYEAYMSEYDLKALDRIPTTKWKFPITKRYRGQEGLESGILDFLKATIVSTSPQPIFIYSDHPIEHLSKNRDTISKWRKAIGAAILRGKQIQILHSFDRNYKEMLIGIDNWIPLYMTGKVQSFYSEGGSNKLFSHVLMVSGSAVFSGFATGDSEGDYIFSKVSTRISEGRAAANSLISEADPLVKVFERNNREEYREYLTEDAKIEGSRIVYSDSLPIYTVSDSLLEEMLADNNIDEETADTVRDLAAKGREIVSEILKHSPLIEIVKVHDSHKVYDEHDASILRIPEGVDLRYTPRQYSEHKRLTEQFAEKNENYKLKETDTLMFKRVRIILHSGKHAIITRNTGRVLNMMIKHPRIIESIEERLRTMDRKLPGRVADHIEEYKSDKDRTK